MDFLYTEFFYSSLFLIGGCILLFLEIFIPSGGILGISAFASAAFGIFGFWWQGRGALASLCIVGYVAYSALLLKVVLRRVSFKGALTTDSSTSVDERIQDNLVGAEGVAVTPLRPSGSALIRGQRVDVVSLGEFVDKDAAVKVVDTSGNRVVVREFQARSIA